MLLDVITDWLVHGIKSGLGNLAVGRWTRDQEVTG